MCNKILLTIALFIAALLISCNGGTYKIPEADKALIPYKGNEVLIFKSNKGDVDTVFLQGIEEFTSPINQWSFPIKHIEHHVLVSRRSDFYPKSAKRYYLDSLPTVILYNDDTTRIEIEFSVKNACLYSDKIYTKDQFLHLSHTTLKIGEKLYDDVLIVKPNEVWERHKNGRLVEDANTITKLYWSKSQGIVRYDISNGEYWELKNNKSKGD